MIDQKTSIFEYIDNFAKTAIIPTITIFESNLDYLPEITIAIPTYKRADLLKDAINSAINQYEYTYYDIIVVDNDSTRGCETEKLMMSFNNPKISYYKNSENLGMSGNWNRLFTLSRGKYVVMLHDDDLLLPHFLYECIKIAKEKNADLIKPLAYDVDFQNVDIDLFKTVVRNKIKRIYDISNLHGNALGAPTGCFLKKECVIKLGGFNQDFYPSMDFYFLVYFSMFFKCFRLCNKLYVYRKVMSTSANKNVLDKFIKNDFYLYKQLLNKYKIPNVFAKKFLSYRFFRTIESNRTYWKMTDYDFDITELGLKKNDYRIGGLISKILRIYVYIIQSCKKMKSNSNVLSC